MADRVRNPGAHTASSGADMPVMAPSDIYRLRKMVEPERTSNWLRACFIEDPSAAVKHVDLCQAYHRTFANQRHLLKAPLLESEVLLDTALRMFESSQLDATVDYTVQGIRARTFCVVAEGMPSADEIRKAVPQSGISLACLVRIFEARLLPDSFNAISEFFSLAESVTTRNARTGLLFPLAPAAEVVKRSPAAAGSQMEEKAKRIVAGFRVYPPPALPAAEVGEYCKRLLSSYGTALTRQGAAFEARKAVQGVLRALQQDGLAVPKAVWKRVEETDKVFRAADGEVQKIRRANEVRWAAVLSSQRQRPKKELLGSNATFSFREAADSSDAAIGPPFVLVEGELGRWMKSMERLLVQNGVWMQCVNARPPTDSHPLFAIPLAKWDAKAVEAAKVMKRYINPNLLSRIPAERWEDYQTRRGLKGSFLAEAHRMLPHEIRSAGIWSQHWPLTLTPRFGRPGFSHLEDRVIDFYQAEYTRGVGPERTSGYYLLEQLKRYAKPFRLMDLPPELRLSIYEWALMDAEPIKVVEAKRGEHLRYQPPPPLTRTCHDMRAQTLPIYYAINDFELILDANRVKTANSDGWEARLMVAWFSKIGDSYHNDGKSSRFAGGEKVPDHDILRKMRSVAVTFQVREMRPNIRFIVPLRYQMARVGVQYTPAEGLKVSWPTTLVYRQLHDRNTALVYDDEMVRRERGRILLLFFGSHQMWLEWRLDAVTGIWWGGIMAVYCTGH